MWITLAILIAAIVLFITEKLRVDVVALGVVVLLMLTGVLTTSEALAGFSNTAVLTIASLFIIGGAVLNTGLAGMIADRIVQVAGTSETRLIVVIILAAAVMSGFMSDTGVVAVMLPTIISIARSVKISPSRLLIPLAYGALLGGASTLIGTPPNLIVSDLLRQEGLPAFGFFTYTPVGLILIAVGVIFMLTLGRRLLPDHRQSPSTAPLISPQELVELYDLPNDLFRLCLKLDSALAVQSLAGSRLRSDFQVNVLEILRPAPVLMAAEANIAGQADNYRRLHPMPETQLRAHDILVVQGDEEDVTRAAAHWNLESSACHPGGP